jgi:hypothetical protein
MTHEDYIRLATRIVENPPPGIDRDGPAFLVMVHLLAEVKDLRNLLLLEELRRANDVMPHPPGEDHDRTHKRLQEFEELLDKIRKDPFRRVIDEAVESEINSLRQEAIQAHRKDHPEGEDMRWLPRDEG